MTCIEEWVMKRMLKIVAYLPVYTAIVTTLTLIVVIWGIPYLH